MTPVEGGKTQEKNKIKRMAKKCIKCIPKKVYRNGVAFHQCSCPDCKYTRKSWGAIDTHIMIEHLKCKYVCKECEKELWGCKDTCKFFTLKKNDFMYVEVRLILDHLKDGMMYKKDT